MSHNNEQDIIDNIELFKISELHNVSIEIRDNTNSTDLKVFCCEKKYGYHVNESKKGFGDNNNLNFYESMKAKEQSKEWFILINPDVVITYEAFLTLMSKLDSEQANLLTINLCTDEDLKVEEQSLRKFPSFRSLFNVFLGKTITEKYDKNNVADGNYVDWAPGSFLIFSSYLFESLNGFNEKYFMYYEDVDICFRAKLNFGYRVKFLKNVKAYHRGGFKNRSIMSPHFKWYIKSLFRFLFFRFRNTFTR